MSRFGKRKYFATTNLLQSVFIRFAQFNAVGKGEKQHVLIGHCRAEKVWWNDEIIGITPSYLILFILINRPIIHLKTANLQPVFQPYKGRLKVLVLPP